MHSLPDFLFLSLFQCLDHASKITITIMVTNEIDLLTFHSRLAEIWPTSLKGKVVLCQ